jgi:hypothetical protein
MTRIAGLSWLAYALWEALVQWRTPEASIRIDLLLIAPWLLAITLAAAWQMARGGRVRAP